MNVRRIRHGGVLLEVMLAVALFVAAGLAVVSASDRASMASEHARLAVRAGDLARSAMALIEAGLATPESLHGPVRSWRSIAGAVDEGPVAEGPAPDERGWELQIQTEPLALDGLVKVSVEARLLSESGLVRASRRLIQVVPSRGGGA
ncbi:MAG: hypothetical protein FJ255_07340 [Phycisphaerae bacterium]|nr:hypothetical protein [Phycisphaerae bacterium]